jgi:hypothetical protein
VTWVRMLFALAVVPAVALAQARAGPFDPFGGDADKPKAAPAEAKAPTSQPSAATARSLEIMVARYLELHREHLKSKYWMGRAMAVIGLAVLDDPRAVTELGRVARTDAAAAVRAFAWGSLNAHVNSMTDEQRKTWLKTGLSLEAKGALRGDLRAVLLRGLTPYGPAASNRTLFRRLFASTSTQSCSDYETLRALRASLTAWRDPVLAGQLVRAMDNWHNAYRAEYVLAGLAAGVKPMAVDWKVGSEQMRQRGQARYRQWLAGARLRAVRPGQAAAGVFGGGFDGGFTSPVQLTPAPVKITDPYDLKWRRKLELPRFRLEQIDVTFVVDSTGSMGQVLFWLRQEVGKMMRACGMISKTPRIGVVLYRDHGDEYVVKPVWLTGNAKALLGAIGGVSAQGGGDVAEAVYEGLLAAVTRQKWSTGPRTHRALVLVGDAPPHRNTTERIHKLMAAAAEKDFHVYCVKAVTAAGGRDLSSFDQIAQWGKGESVWASFGAGPGNVAGARDVLEVGAGYLSPTRTLVPLTARDKLPNRIVRRIMMTGTPDEYKDRVTPFVNLLMECVGEPIPEMQIRYLPYQPAAEYGPPRHPQQR